jgi:hypothetical protein
MICTSDKGRFTDDDESRTATRREMDPTTFSPFG